MHDALGRVVSETRGIGARSYTTSYAYDAADHVTQITYPSGRIVTYGRNSLGQVSGVTTKQNALAASQNVATGITWKPMSDLMASLTHRNGLSLRRAMIWITVSARSWFRTRTPLSQVSHTSTPTA